MSGKEAPITMNPPEQPQPPPAYPAAPQQQNSYINQPQQPPFPNQPQHSYSSQPQQSPYPNQPQPSFSNQPQQSHLDPAAAAALAGQNYRDQLFAQCAVGNHERTTSYGIGGILAAVICFPCGLICLFMDTEDKCARCGVHLPK